MEIKRDFYLNELIDRMDNDKCYLISNEIQKVKEFEFVLIDFMYINNVEIYVIGSNSK